MTALSRSYLTCRRCRKRKRADEFWPNPRISTGRSSWCKTCAAASSRASRAKHKDAYNAKRRQPSQERRCEVCGATFESSHPLARYCPPTAEDRERQQGVARSRCARRALNAQYRGQELTAPLPQPFECAYCGRRCVPGEDGVDYRATKFCCHRHKAAYHREAGRDEVAA